MLGKRTVAAIALTVGIRAASTASLTTGNDASQTLAPRDNLNSIDCLPLCKKFERSIDIPSVVADNAFPKSIPAMGIIF